MKEIYMSIKEVNRVSILDQLKRKAMKQKRAASILGVSVRQVQRLLKRYRREGAPVLVHHLRGIPSNNQADPAVLDAAIATIRERYADFSVTLAHEKLTEHHGFLYSRETLRGAMIVGGLWKPTRKKTPVVHELRDRRASEGELVQVDGSPHWWFEERGPTCTLLVYIDDATGKLKWLEFVPSKTTNVYFAATKAYLEHHGKPLAFYVDRHGVFRVNTTKALTAPVEDSNGKTQFGRAMEEGNRFLPQFVEEFNRKFSVIPKSVMNLHRPLTDHEHLEDILVQKHIRRLSTQLTLSYGSKIYQTQTDHPTYAMRHATVTVQEDAQGIVTIRYHQIPLSYRIIKQHQKSEIVDSKHVNIAVDRV